MPGTGTGRGDCGDVCEQNFHFNVHDRSGGFFDGVANGHRGWPP